MPDDLSLLDQLEEWLESQVPHNIHDFPLRMLETMERMSNELMETLNIHAPASISIPFPPFLAKETHAVAKTCCHPKPPAGLYHRAGRLIKAHPYAVGTGAALVMTVGLGVGTYLVKSGSTRMKRIRARGVVENGMLKEAIVLLSPSPMPPMLWPLAVSLLKAGYVVLIAVPHVDDAEALEKRLAPLEERSALRVLIYDPEDSSTFPAFHRSLLATLTLRFPAPHAQVSGDPYHPEPTHVPRIHAFVSLYPLNPAPPSQPGALPALPTLLTPTNGRTPMLVTLYPSGSVVVRPDSFASQVLTSTHRLLGQNLAASSSARMISVFIGHLNLPPLHQMLGNAKLMIYRFTFKDKWRQASVIGKFGVLKDAAFHGVSQAYAIITGQFGIGAAAKDYAIFERRFLRLLKSRHGDHWALGQYAMLPFMLTRLPPRVIPTVLGIMPTLPGATGPLYASVQGLPAPRKKLGGSGSSATSSQANKSTPNSASSSDHESGEDLASSLHSLRSAHSRETTSSRGDQSSASGNGLDESWTNIEGA